MPRSARAVDLPDVSGKPVRLDVTNATILGQRFNARTSEGQLLQEHGWGFWVNRLNLQLNWDRFVFGARLDSSYYWLRPVDRDVTDPALRPGLVRDGTSAFRDAIYPAKLFATYNAPGVEVTLGDAYVQFGRGLVLSMRKVDDLGLDTTVRGAKVQVQKDPIGFTAIAGLANPSRVDEATGRALFLPRPTPGDPLTPLPVFGSDRIVGAEVQAGRGLPIVLSTHVARLTRCAPFRYDASGRVVEGPLGDPLGSCREDDRQLFLDSLPTGLGPAVNAAEIINLGQSVELPRVGKLGSLYVGGATQRRRYAGDLEVEHPEGNALYATYTGSIGRVTNTLEAKSYRNFFPMSASVDGTRAGAFSNVVYSIPPTAEVITQDSAFGFFNTCVNGGRLRTDVRVSDPLLLYTQAIYARTQSEEIGGGCDRFGRTVSSKRADEITNNVWDGTAGIQLQWDLNRSYLYALVGGRDDRRVNGELFYREWRAEYTFSKWIGGPYSIEFIGRHRIREEDLQNLRGPGGTREPWLQGEHYTAFKVAPEWVISQGFEYTTQLGQPTYYVNGSVLYRFTSGSNVRVFVGQQRGGLRCVSGVCRMFPAYEGARVELTLRF